MGSFCATPIGGNHGCRLDLAVCCELDAAALEQKILAYRKTTNAPGAASGRRGAADDLNVIVLPVRQPGRAARHRPGR
jgi:hypothetical protein